MAMGTVSKDKRKRPKKKIKQNTKEKISRERRECLC